MKSNAKYLRSSGGGAFAPIGATAMLAMTDPNVSAGSAYLYRVEALGAAGVLAPSNVDLAVVRRSRRSRRAPERCI